MNGQGGDQRGVGQGRKARIGGIGSDDGGARGAKKKIIGRINGQGRGINRGGTHTAAESGGGSPNIHGRIIGFCGGNQEIARGVADHSPVSRHGGGKNRGDGSRGRRG